MIIIKRLLLLLACITLILNTALAQDLPDLIAKMKAYMDPNANPCDDFYAFACGGYSKSHPVPKNLSDGHYDDWPMQTDWQNYVFAKMKELVREPHPIIGDHYESCMKPTDAMKLDFNVTYEKYRAKIPGWIKSLNTPEGLGEFFGHTNFLRAFVSLGLAFGTLEGTYLAPPLTYLIDLDRYENKTEYNEEFEMILNLFNEFDPKTARDQATKVMDIEKYIASFFDSDPFHEIQTTVKNASTLLNFDVLEYSRVSDLGYTSNTNIIINTPSYMLNVTKFVNSIPALTLQRYLEWKLFYTMRYADVQVFCNSTGTWNSMLCGADQSDLCTTWTVEALTDIVLVAYQDAVLNDKSRDTLLNLTSYLEQAFLADLPTRPWLINQTSISAIKDKVNRMLVTFEVPAFLVNDYRGVYTDPDTWFENTFQIGKSSLSFWSRLIYTTPNRSMLVDKSTLAQEQQQQLQSEPGQLFGDFFNFDWITPYQPQYNYINWLRFREPSIEGPFYQTSWPKLFQYAGMGGYVASQFAAGFEGYGIYFNGTGDYDYNNPIYDPKTLLAFNNQSQCIVNQYSKYVIIGNTTVRGDSTLNDNLGDIFGLKYSYNAYQKYIATFGKEFLDGALIPGLSTNQIFFLQAAQGFCRVQSNSTFVDLALYGYQVPNKYRVNGPSSQFKPFSDAFRCPVGSGMNPAPKCNVW